MQILAFDFGTQFIGVAVGQTITKTSSPLIVIDVARDGEEIWTTISNLIDEWKPDQLLVGKPLNMDGTPSQSSQSAKDLAINLSKDVTENITLWDERLSSQGAFNLSNDLTSNTSNKIKKLDKNSAQFILQGALDYFSKENT